jgi:hypothetical protein
MLTCARFPCPQRVAYVYRGQKEINGTKVRVIWGKITRSHGNNGVVRTKFRRNLPPRSFGANVRVVRPRGARAVIGRGNLIRRAPRCCTRPTSRWMPDEDPRWDGAELGTVAVILPFLCASQALVQRARL